MWEEQQHSSPSGAASSSDVLGHRASQAGASSTSGASYSTGVEDLPRSLSGGLRPRSYSDRPRSYSDQHWPQEASQPIQTIVKNTFIQVVREQNEPSLRRSASDSDLDRSSDPGDDRMPWLAASSRRKEEVTPNYGASSNQGKRSDVTSLEEEAISSPGTPSGAAPNDQVSDVSVKGRVQQRAASSWAGAPPIQTIVKNTFIEIVDDCPSASGSLRRCASDSDLDRLSESGDTLGEGVKLMRQVRSFSEDYSTSSASEVLSPKASMSAPERQSVSRPRVSRTALTSPEVTPRSSFSAGHGGAASKGAPRVSVGDFLLESCGSNSLHASRTGIVEPGLSEEVQAALRELHADEGLGEALSVGALKHAAGECEPCLFWFRGCCSRGIHCHFCHLRHLQSNRRKTRRSKKGRMQKWQDEFGSGDISDKSGSDATQPDLPGSGPGSSSQPGPTGQHSTDK